MASASGRCGSYCRSSSVTDGVMGSPGMRASRSGPASARSHPFRARCRCQCACGACGHRFRCAAMRQEIARQASRDRVTRRRRFADLLVPACKRSDDFRRLRRWPGASPPGRPSSRFRHTEPGSLAWSRHAELAVADSIMSLNRSLIAFQVLGRPGNRFALKQTSDAWAMLPSGRDSPLRLIGRTRTRLAPSICQSRGFRMSSLKIQAGIATGDRRRGQFLACRTSRTHRPPNRRHCCWPVYARLRSLGSGDPQASAECPERRLDQCLHHLFVQQPRASRLRLVSM